MDKLKIYPGNRKYYSEEFIQGWECGVQNQFDADKNYLEDLFVQIVSDIEHWESDDTHDDYQIGAMDMKNYVLRVINKYRLNKQNKVADA